MNAQNGLKTICKLADYATIGGMGLIVSGSVGYRSALKYPENFIPCDDLDCLLVYKDISDVYASQFVSKELIKTAKSLLNDKCDIFATKKKLNEVKISIDFISLSYLEELCEERIDGRDKFRKKLTDAVEIPSHTYTDWFGNQLYYRKRCTEFGPYRIYELPIHLFSKGSFFAGVLLTKFLFNPAHIVDIGNQRECVALIQDNIIKSCPKGGKVSNLYWKKNNFSKETLQLLSTGEKE